MNHEERMTKLIKLDLKLQFEGHVMCYSDTNILVKGTITAINT